MWSLTSLLQVCDTVQLLGHCEWQVSMGQFAERVEEGTWHSWDCRNQIRIPFWCQTNPRTHSSHIHGVCLPPQPNWVIPEGHPLLACGACFHSPCLARALPPSFLDPRLLFVLLWALTSGLTTASLAGLGWNLMCVCALALILALSLQAENTLTSQGLTFCQCQER